MNTSPPDQLLVEALRLANPRREPLVASALDETAERDFQRIVSTIDSVASAAEGRSRKTWPVGCQRRPLTRRSVVGLSAAAAFVGLLAAVTLVGSGISSRIAPKAFAATPALLKIRSSKRADSSSDASRVFRVLAARADRQQWSDGRYLYTRYRSWALNVAVSGGSVATAVVPTATQVWRAGDDSGRIKMTTRPPRSIAGANASNRKAASATLPNIDTQDTRADFQGNPDVRSLSTTSPSVLEAQLLGPGRIPAQGSIATYLTELTGYEQFQPLPPALQANLWRLLANSDDFVDLGTAVDRAGRTGDAIAYDTTAPAAAILPTRFLFVINPHTGLLLDSERILTTDPGNLPVHIPAVVDYTVFLAGGTRSSDMGRASG